MLIRFFILETRLINLFSIQRIFYIKNLWRARERERERERELVYVSVSMLMCARVLDGFIVSVALDVSIFLSFYGVL